jgi:hypothetical protein
MAVRKRGKDKASTDDMGRVIFVHGLDENERPAIIDWPDFGIKAEGRRKLTRKAEGRGPTEREKR